MLGRTTDFLQDASRQSDDARAVGGRTGTGKSFQNIKILLEMGIYCVRKEFCNHRTRYPNCFTEVSPVGKI